MHTIDEDPEPGDLKKDASTLNLVHINGGGFQASVKCPLCGSATANFSSITPKPNANGTPSTTSLPMPAVGDPPPPPPPAPAPVTTTTAPVSEVPMYTCQHHVGVEGCGVNGGDAVPYYEEMQQQQAEEELLFCLEDAASIHNTLVGPTPFF
ncbi:hypothetical protein PIB30_052039 [Stylosanthes scabra]|uniref:Uncharacterized protein n=1 Tax=Stylosanthes scabra TaxID=79078 RepID=A0ABU6SIM3_9FABA|nr:hypothetical protein [Stylosanthes scabra]